MLERQPLVQPEGAQAITYCGRGELLAEFRAEERYLLQELGKVRMTIRGLEDAILEAAPPHG